MSCSLYSFRALKELLCIFDSTGRSWSASLMATMASTYGAIECYALRFIFYSYKQLSTLFAPFAFGKKKYLCQRVLLLRKKALFWSRSRNFLAVLLPGI